MTVNFSEPSGFYTDSIELSLSVDHPDAIIYYTTDGSEPDLNSQAYSEPFLLESREGDANEISMIPTNNISPGHPYREEWQPPAGEIFKIHAIRARAFLPDGTSGQIYSASYVVDESGADRFSMPVFSIKTDPDNLFSDDIGIYVHGNSSNGNFHQRGRDWERDVHIEFFEKDGSLAFAQDAGVRIHGGTTRNRPRKSLRLYARSDYGITWFNYQLFPDKPIARHKRFLLRNSGNDWSESIFRDAYMQSLIVENMSLLDKQHTRAAIVFINGEYWGVHNIRDRYDHRYLQEHYGLDNDRVTILENNAELDSGNPDGRDHYLNLYNFVLNQDMGVQINFNYAANRMDMDNYIDYNIIQIYTRNTDWPGNNVRFWRYIDGDPLEDLPYGQDGRWRWMLFDLDFGFGLDFDYVYNFGSGYGDNDAFHNTLDFALEPSGPNWPNPPWSTALFRNLMENDGFRETFINRFADHLNTTFKADRAVAVFDSLKAVYEPEIDEHIHRWREPTQSHWENDLSVIREFAELREDAMRNIINDRFDLGGTETITLSVNNTAKGIIKVNTMTLSSALDGVDDPVYPWSGIYYRDHPVRLIAVPEAGYRFDGWTGDYSSSSDTVYVTLESAKQITANFSADDPFEGDEMNPAPFDISQDHYEFNYWSADEPEGSFPPNMVFQQSSVNDPGLDEPMTDPYFIPFIDEDDNEYHADDQDKFGYPYMLTGRTRLNGLSSDGISMINTGRGRDLGAVVLALDTRGENNLAIHWVAETLQANSRTYNVRLQYRTGLQAEWKDVLDHDGEIVEYQRDFEEGPTEFSEIPFPEDAYNRAYVQLRWKYYYTGTRLSEDSGQRDEIRIDDIFIENVSITSNEGSETAKEFELHQNYPNPFNPVTVISYQLEHGTEIQLEVFDILGRKVAVLADGFREAGTHRVEFNALDLSSGVYIYRLRSNEFELNRSMTLIK